MNALDDILSKCQEHNFELLLIFVAIISTSFGWFLIAGLRMWARKSSNPQILAYLPILSPILFYGLFSLLYHADYISAAVGDCATLFIMNGIILRLSVKSTNSASIRLAINVKGSSEFKDVWLKNDEVTVGDTKQLIAKTLNVSANRVNIESGKGNFLKDISDNSAMLLNLIDAENAKNKDLFGFCTVPCYVTITEEMVAATKPKSAATRVFPAVELKSSSIKYGSNITLQGKIPNSANDTKAFGFSIVNKFAAVAPSLHTIRSTSNFSDVIRLVSWREDCDDAANVVSSFENSLAGQKVKNGENRSA